MARLAKYPPPGERKRKRPRSSRTGRFVSWLYALRHPSTTQAEERKGKGSSGT